MSRYLLDTNMISDLLRNPAGPVAARVEALAPGEQVCTSIIVAAELRYGAIKKKSAALTARIEEVLEVIEVLALMPDADRHYGALRAELEIRGTPIGANDMLIAAHALAADCILVTNNTKEFQRVRRLKVQNWLRSPD